MRRILGAALVLTMMLSITLIASAQTGSVEIRGHIVGTDEPVAQYRVTYHANGGWGGSNGPYVTAGGTDRVYPLSMTGITRSGYSFTGWNTRGDGRGISYAAGDSITLNSDVILYAQWRKIAETYPSLGGVSVTGSSGSGRTPPWSNGTITIHDGTVPASDGVTTPSGGTVLFSPDTGDASILPLCVGLLCVSLAVMIFLLQAERREKQLDEKKA